MALSSDEASSFAEELKGNEDSLVAAWTEEVARTLRGRISHAELQRQTLELLTSFGDGGRQPGLFYGVHSIAVDSKGNIYTTETYRGQRVQRFMYKGLAAVTKKDQGVLWPRSTK